MRTVNTAVVTTLNLSFCIGTSLEVVRAVLFGEVDGKIGIFRIEIALSDIGYPRGRDIFGSHSSPANVRAPLVILDHVN